MDVPNFSFLLYKVIEMVARIKGASKTPTDTCRMFPKNNTLEGQPKAERQRGQKRPNPGGSL